MARVKRGVQANRRHKILKRAKGYYGARSRVYRVAVQAATKVFTLIDPPGSKFRSCPSMDRLVSTLVHA